MTLWTEKIRDLLNSFTKKAAKKDDDVIEAEATEIKEPHASEASSETVSETPAASGAGEEKKV